MAENDVKKKAYEDYLIKAKGDEAKIARLNEAYNLSLRKFVTVGNRELGLGCPSDLPIECWDGSCVKSKEDCPPRIPLP